MTARRARHGDMTKRYVTADGPAQTRKVIGVDWADGGNADRIEVMPLSAALAVPSEYQTLSVLTVSAVRSGHPRTIRFETPRRWFHVFPGVFSSSVHTGIHHRTARAQRVMRCCRV